MTPEERLRDAWLSEMWAPVKEQPRRPEPVEECGRNVHKRGKKAAV